MYLFINFQFFSDEYLIIRANAVLCTFVALYFMIYCVKCQLELHFFTTHLGGDWEVLRGVIKKRFIAFRPHIYVSAKFGVCSFYGFRETLSGHDRQTHRHRHRTDVLKPIFLVALFKNIYTL